MPPIYNARTLKAIFKVKDRSMTFRTWKPQDLNSVLPLAAGSVQVQSLGSEKGKWDPYVEEACHHCDTDMGVPISELCQHPSRNPPCWAAIQFI